ncbi:MAG: PEGA domain-containing protein [Oligosphaeraceae bacterium]|nr:PEGA domain-containing protein [Oligosphaeraceae bacterium]
MRLKVLKGDEPGKIIPLTEMIFTIGRDPGNKLVINESGVSRHHCSIRSQDGRWQIEDCNSVNGVLLNDERITDKKVLRPGDRITVFNHEFLFIEDEGKEASSDAKALAGNERGLPRFAIPWGKLLILVIILSMVVWLAIKVFAPANEPGSQAATIQVSEPAEPDALEPGLEPVPALVTQSEEAPAYDRQESTDMTARDREAWSMPLTSDGDGLLLLESEPQGAEVYVDGVKQAGRTPLILRQLAQGRHTVELRKEGYENSERIVQIPDRLASRPIILQQKPGTLLLRSNPSGAHVWHERQLLGVTPLLIDSLTPGAYKLTVRGPGCEIKKVDVHINNIRGEQMELNLQSSLGNLEIVTQPANCEVYLQDAFMGRTLPQSGKGESQVLRLQNVIAGEQNLRVRHSSGISSRGRVAIPRSDTLQRKITLRIPTHKVELHNNEVFIGTLLEQNVAGDVVLEDKSGKAERFLKPQIMRIQELSDKEIQTLVEEKRSNDNDLLSISELERTMQSVSLDDFNRNHAGKTYSMHGRPGMIMSDARGTSTVIFSTKVRAQFPGLSKDEINEMNAASTSGVTFKGTVQGVDAEGVLTLKNCRLVDEF